MPFPLEVLLQLPHEHHLRIVIYNPTYLELDNCRRPIVEKWVNAVVLELLSTAL